MSAELEAPKVEKRDPQIKAKLLRESGRPVDLVKIKEYETEFKAAFDELQKRYDEENKKTSDIPKNQRYNMEDFKNDLDGVDEELAQKYDTILDIDVPNSFDDWNAIIEKYEAPVTIAVHAETEEVFLTLRDMGF